MAATVTTAFCSHSTRAALTGTIRPVVPDKEGDWSAKSERMTVIPHLK